MDGWTDGRTDGWTDGWMDERMDGWIDGWMEAHPPTGWLGWEVCMSGGVRINIPLFY